MTCDFDLELAELKNRLEAVRIELSNNKKLLAEIENTAGTFSKIKEKVNNSLQNTLDTINNRLAKKEVAQKFKENYLNGTKNVINGTETNNASGYILEAINELKTRYDDVAERIDENQRTISEIEYKIREVEAKKFQMESE